MNYLWAQTLVISYDVKLTLQKPYILAEEEHKKLYLEVFFLTCI